MDRLATGSGDKTARLQPYGQRLVDLACARVHDLPLLELGKQNFGIENEWWTPEVSAALRAKLGLDMPPLISLPSTDVRFRPTPRCSFWRTCVDPAAAQPGRRCRSDRPGERYWQIPPIVVK
ncbi:MAG: hypothetical protein IPK66_12230 [Rhodospirillales bacterium]|nr:hypothetical protein [Rhodospirillales bacterium]